MIQAVCFDGSCRLSNTELIAHQLEEEPAHKGAPCKLSVTPNPPPMASPTFYYSVPIKQKHTALD